MPRGAYLHLSSGVVEEFQCAPGPAGWRYVAPGVDLTVDSRWRPARLELKTSSWTLRGGSAGRDLLWVRGDREHSAEALAFLGASPAFLIAIARSLRLAPGAFATLPLVEITGESLATRTTTHRWTLVSVESHPTDLGPLPVETWQTTDLETAETTGFHLAGDVVLAAPDLELTRLDSPPTL
ncbi:hypothetical protein [Actinocorallia populi]|uniref:hypothetical protein n=1 Tax=Actinocorallia populi TaxID=2079200 RepID=UPI000D08842C|nr:hypothetical protein [Actinocorallia populi]